MRLRLRVLDRWKDVTKGSKVGVVGCEILGIRHYCMPEPSRSLAEIDTGLRACTGRILRMLGEVEV